MKQEENLQIALSTYIKLQYPRVIFCSESSGIRVGKRAASVLKKCRSEGKLPDMLILEPNYLYSGLCLELKKDGTRIKKKDGSYSTLHIWEQAKTIDRLRAKGYYADFAIGFTEAKAMVDAYMQIIKK